ncbi:MAG: hypothetical protein EBT41_11750, partial [Betaproteobacteria bacterium]|nr:hypothetical protein [Betaproteobacteria bacterium]
RLHDRICVITYEALVENPALLEPITGHAALIPEGLISKRDIGFYGQDRAPIIDMLKRVGTHYTHFYTL